MTIPFMSNPTNNGLVLAFAYSCVIVESCRQGLICRAVIVGVLVY